jgi:flagellar motor switch/type III secretory pathway protein FliN
VLEGRYSHIYITLGREKKEVAMSEQLERFFRESDVPGRIRLPAEVVVHRTTLSPADLVETRKNGRFVASDREGDTCELEVGGQVVAIGKIVKKGKNWYFRVQKTSDKGGAS